MSSTVLQGRKGWLAPPDERRAGPSRLGSATAPGLRHVGVAGIGSHVPARLLGNADLERMVTTSDEWIRKRTGIRERHVVATGEATSDLAVVAARKALAAARLDPAQVELILVATATPDHPTPPTTCLVQHRLGASHAAGFDVNAACSGFVNALMTAHHMVASGAFENALVIGADVLSSITDYTDRESCVLFGDGAGAVVLAPGASCGELIDHVVGIDGSGADLISVDAGGSRRPASPTTLEERGHYLRLKGREVFRFATAKIRELVSEMLEHHGLSIDELGLLVPHQANARIIEAAARALGLPTGRVLANVERYGNTSNASIPLALDEAVRAGRLESGKPVVLVAFGGGLTWGCSLLRW